MSRMGSLVTRDTGSACISYSSAVENAYHYQPSLAAGLLFTALFALSGIAHIFQTCWKRMWWCHVFSIGCLVEVLGWAARTWSAACPYELNAFLMQIATLIIGPTFFTAGIYIILGRLILYAGRDSSFLSPRMYLWIFCTCDLISLVVQAVGGGLAATAVADNRETETGTNIMVVGIVFQMASITVFVVCAGDFLYRVARRQLLYLMTNRNRLLLLTTLLSIVFIYIRSIYRTIELLQGWTGYLIVHEVYFIALDGAMMVPAVTVFNLFHPAWLLPSDEAHKRVQSLGNDTIVGSEHEMLAQG